MDAYRSILEEIARRELLFAILVVCILLLIIGSLWVSNFVYCRKMKKKHPKKYNSEKQIKTRRQSLCASVALTVICVSLIVFFCVNASSTISKINKDIEENSYITYTGGYEVHITSATGRKVFARRMMIRFDDAGYAFAYRNRFEDILADFERFQGTVVYGKHSLIVVQIGGEEI